MSVENLTVPSSEISTRGVVPRTPMVATGVSTFISPVFATLPATKVNVPLVKLNKVVLDVLFGSYTNSFKTMRALFDRLKEVPSVKFRDISSERSGENSAQIRERVLAARHRQQARFASDAQLLPIKPTFDLLVFETVNFMDGRRTTSQVSDLLSAEFPLELDETWVNRLLGILEKQGLAAER